MNLGKASIVIYACNEGENLLDMVNCLLENTSYPDFDIVIVDDGSTDGSSNQLSQQFGDNARITLQQSTGLGVAQGRNLGAAVATGDILIFLDGHCYLPPGWLTPLVVPFAHSAVGMVGSAITNLAQGGGADAAGVTWRDPSLQLHWIPHQSSQNPYPVPLLPGGCQAVRRAEFEEMGGYDSGMTRWGSESEELSLRYWLMGYQVVAQPTALVYHLFREKGPYGVNITDVIYNRLRLAALHFSPERMARVITWLSQATPDFEPIREALDTSDVQSRREEFLLKRRYDDDWFCAQFGCAV